jgi:hypothetical protein
MGGGRRGVESTTALHFVLPTDLLPDPVDLDDTGAPFHALSRPHRSDTSQDGESERSGPYGA